MKKQLFSFFLIISFAFYGFAQKSQLGKADSTAGNLRAHVEYLASDKLEGRRTGEKGATYAAGYIADLFARYKLQAGISQTVGGKTKSNFLQPFPFTASVESAKSDLENSAQKPSEGYNVIGVLEGTDANFKKEAIVIGAHYDHLGHGGQGSLATNSSETHHGADDNASGVAGLLELARRFSAERKNKRTIIFVAFGGEEEGLFGSKFYVDNPALSLEKTVAMINMDMIGRLKENKLTIGGIGTASEWKSLVESQNPKEVEKIVTIGEENLKLKQTIQDNLRKELLNDVQVEVEDNRTYLYGNVDRGKMAAAVQITQEVGKKPVYNSLIEKSNIGLQRVPVKPFILQLNEDGFVPGDHSSFYVRKIPVLFFFTGEHADYHKPTDTADKINYEGLERVTNFIAEIVKEIDRNPKKPTYAVALSLGIGEGQRDFNVSLGTMPN